MNGMEFWRNIKKGGDEECWEWQRGENAKGYGLLSFPQMGRTTQKAHRVAYFLSLGLIPRGKHILHRCDNPRCCNPSHLYVGANPDNARDRKIRGRQQRGEGVFTAKLTEEQVRAIREEYIARQTSCERLADKYPINASSIWLVLTYRSWPNVAPELRDKVIMVPKVRRGEMAPRARLAEHQAIEIRRRHKCGEGTADLAREFGLARVSIWRLVKRQTWKHLP